MEKYLVSVADVRGYTEDDQLIFEGKTELDSSIETTLSNTDVRAGQGNQLKYIFYHSAELNATITDAQFSLDYIALNVGSQVDVGTELYIDETIDLVAGAGTVAGTPTKTGNSVVYGWVIFEDGEIERVTFSGKTFTTSRTTSTETICIRYYNADASAREVRVTANMVPSTVKLVMDCMLCSSDATTNRIGKVQIIIPKASMTGAFKLSMTPDAVSSTPLSIRALAYSQTGGGCSGTEPLYARIIEKIDDFNWYDNVNMLGVVGGDFVLANGATKQLQIKAIPSSGSAFTPDYSKLTFSKTGNITVSAGGLVTGATGGGTILVSITDKPAIEVTVKVTDA